MSDSPSDTPSKESSINSVPKPQEELQPPATTPVPPTGIPEEPVVAWTDQETEASIAKMRPLLAKMDKSVLRAKDITLKVLRELFRAKRALTSPGARNDLSSRQTPRGWAPYCERLGRSVRTFDRWLEQYDPKGDCLKPKVLSLDAEGQGETTDTVYGSNKRKLSQLETDVVKGLVRMGYAKVVARHHVIEASASLPGNPGPEVLTARALAIAGGEKFSPAPRKPLSAFDRVVEALSTVSSIEEFADAVGVDAEILRNRFRKEEPPDKSDAGVDQQEDEVQVDQEEDGVDPIIPLSKRPRKPPKPDTKEREAYDEELKRIAEKNRMEFEGRPTDDHDTARRVVVVEGSKTEVVEIQGDKSRVIGRQDDEVHKGARPNWSQQRTRDLLKKQGEDGETEEESEAAEKELIEEEEAKEEIEEMEEAYRPWGVFVTSLLKDTGVTQTKDALFKVVKYQLPKFVRNFPRDPNGNPARPPAKYISSITEHLSQIRKYCKEIEDTYNDLATLLQEAEPETIPSTDFTVTKKKENEN